MNEGVPGRSLGQPMLHYFHVLEGAFFHDTLLPALAACRRRRSFAPLRNLLPHLPLAAANDSILVHSLGAAYDRHVFQAVVGETLILTALAMPRLPLDPRTLAAFLAPESLERTTGDRGGLAPIQRAFFGSRDLRIGSYVHRPLHVGWNDADDMRFLAEYLDAVDTSKWSADALRPIDQLRTDEDREEELALASEWWPDFVALYAKGVERGSVIVCEEP